MFPRSPSRRSPRAAGRAIARRTIMLCSRAITQRCPSNPSNRTLRRIPRPIPTRYTAEVSANARSRLKSGRHRAELATQPPGGRALSTTMSGARGTCLGTRRGRQRACVPYSRTLCAGDLLDAQTRSQHLRQRDIAADLWPARRRGGRGGGLPRGGDVRSGRQGRRRDVRQAARASSTLKRARRRSAASTPPTARRSSRCSTTRSAATCRSRTSRRTCRTRSSPPRTTSSTSTTAST